MLIDLATLKANLASFDLTHLKWGKLSLWESSTTNTVRHLWESVRLGKEPLRHLWESVRLVKEPLRHTEPCKESYPHLIILHLSGKQAALFNTYAKNSSLTVGTLYSQWLNLSSHHLYLLLSVDWERIESKTPFRCIYKGEWTWDWRALRLESLKTGKPSQSNWKWAHSKRPDETILTFLTLTSWNGACALQVFTDLLVIWQEKYWDGCVCVE